VSNIPDYILLGSDVWNRQLSPREHLARGSLTGASTARERARSKRKDVFIAAVQRQRTAGQALVLALQTGEGVEEAMHEYNLSNTASSAAQRAYRGLDP
jgi:hypothetical protein